MFKSSDGGPVTMVSLVEVNGTDVAIHLDGEEVAAFDYDASAEDTSILSVNVNELAERGIKLHVRTLVNGEWITEVFPKEEETN